MANPFTILLELIIGLISRTAEAIVFSFSKFYEFFTTLSDLTAGNILATVVGAIIVSIVAYYLLKFIFRSSKTIIILVLTLIILLAVSLLIIGLI